MTDRSETAAARLFPPETMPGETVVPALATEDGPRHDVPRGKVGPVAANAAMFLLLLAGTHFLVDTAAGTVSPLWPTLKSHLSLQDGGVFWLFTAWQLSTSLSQFVFGYLGDRFHSRWMLWLGPLAGIVCLSAIGLSNSPLVVVLLLVVGGLGIAAFHPEAAALAGSCAPGNRSRAMSLFAIGGYFGQAVGPTYSGTMSHHFGLASLAWGIIGGLAALLLLSAGLRRAPEPPPAAHARSMPLSRLLQGRMAGLLVLLAISVLRVMGAIGLPLALAFMLDGRGLSSDNIGLMQSGFMAGIGLGGLACAMWMRRAWELPTLLWLPLAAAPFLIVVPYAGAPLMLAATVGVSGLLIGAALPVQISIGQQMLPEGQRVASSITMGVSWGAGGAIVAAMMAVCQSWQRIEWVFIALAVAAALSAVLSLALPGPPAKPDAPAAP